MADNIKNSNSGAQPPKQPQRSINPCNPPCEDVPNFFTGDYVADAEKMVNDNKPRFTELTTTKMMSFLTLVNSLNNNLLLEKANMSSGEANDAFSEAQQEQFYAIKVRMVFETRDLDVKFFLEQTELLNGLDHIASSKAKFKRYVRYLEALVAYHRYYGGKEQ